MQRRNIVTMTLFIVLGSLPFLMFFGRAWVDGMMRLNIFPIATLIVFGILPSLAYVARAWRARSWSPVKHAGMAIAAGLLAAAVAGIGLRIAMRITALVVGKTPVFTLGGTLLIFVGTMVLGGMFALSFSLVRSRIAAQTLARGLACGIPPFTVFWYPFFRVASGDLKAVPQITVLFATTLVASLWLLYGLLTEKLIQEAERSFFGAAERPQQKAAPAIARQSSSVEGG